MILYTMNCKEEMEYTSPYCIGIWLGSTEQMQRPLKFLKQFKPSANLKEYKRLIFYIYAGNK